MLKEISILFIILMGAISINAIDVNQSVCDQIYYFSIDHYSQKNEITFNSYEFQELKKSIQNNTGILLNDSELTNHFKNFSYYCPDFNLPWSNSPSSKLNFSNSFQKCDTKLNISAFLGFDMDNNLYEFKSVILSKLDCSQIQRFKYLFNYEQIDNYYLVTGIKSWGVYTLLFLVTPLLLIIISYKIYKNYIKNEREFRRIING